MVGTAVLWFPGLVGTAVVWFPGLVGTAVLWFPGLVGTVVLFPGLVGGPVVWFPCVVGTAVLWFPGLVGTVVMFPLGTLVGDAAVLSPGITRSEIIKQTLKSRHAFQIMFPDIVNVISWCGKYRLVVIRMVLKFNTCGLSICTILWL